jgi:hypothetical protein
MQPTRFGRMLALDPVTPLGMSFTADQIGVFRSMMRSRDVTRTVMATAAATLFAPESLLPGAVPRYREGLGELQAFYERLLEQTFGVAEGIWLGTPFNLNLERESGELGRRRSIIHTWCSGARRTLDPTGRSPSHGGCHAGLPARHRAGDRTFDESGIAGALCWLFWRLVRGAARNRVRKTERRQPKMRMTSVRPVDYVSSSASPERSSRTIWRWVCPTNPSIPFS